MEKRTKRWGDRPDAYWIRDLDGLHAIMPHLMNKRTDAEVYVNMEFDVTEALIQWNRVVLYSSSPRFFSSI